VIEVTSRQRLLRTSTLMVPPGRAVVSLAPSDRRAVLRSIVTPGMTWYSRTDSIVPTPSNPASAANSALSERYVFPVRSLARTWNARSLGRNAVSRTEPSVSTLTGLFGFAARTAPTACVSTS